MRLFTIPCGPAVQRLAHLLVLLPLVAGCPGGAPQAVSDAGGAPQVDGPPIVGTSTGDDGGAVTPTPAAVPPCPANAEALFEGVVQRLRAAIDSNGVPGAAIAVVCGGDQVFARGVGVTRQGGAGPVTDHTRFQWASTTKMFTAATAAAMAEDGIVDLKAPISNYLPTVAYGAVTLHDLLTHTAGFPTEFAQHSAQLDQVVLKNAGMAMWSPPGAVWNYSNPGYAVAGFVLQQAAGQPFAQLMATHILGPAGISATMDLATVMAGDFAYGHSTDAPYNEGPIAPDGAYYDTTYYGPMGGLWGSVRDLARWAQVHVEGGGAVLSRDSIQLLRTPHAPTTYPDTSYGMGLFVRTSYTPRKYDHGGSSPGFLTDWSVIPEAGFGVAVVVNGDWYFPEDVVAEAQAAFVSLQDNPTPLPEAPDGWSQYVGQYNDPNALGQVQVTVEGNRLMAHFTSKGSSAQLMQVYGDAYETKLGGEVIDVNFWRAAPDQKASYLVSLWGVAARTGP